MSTMRNMIEDTAEKIFTDLCTKDIVDQAEAGTQPKELWDALYEAGLVLAAVPEELGGSGGTLGDAMAVLKQAGRFAAPIPVAETMLSVWILTKLGQNVPEGSITVALLDESGKAQNVPFAEGADRILGVRLNGSVTLGSGDAFDVSVNTNVAGEERSDVRALPAFEATATLGEIPLADIERMGALFRSVQMAGAMERMLDLSVEHANTRIQFGRPIGSFQAVRQQLAIMAGQVAAASKAADVAVEATEAGGGELEIAVAKARVGEACGIASDIAHQVHGAMGVTHEHNLHQFTRRLWAWRDEFGREQVWQARIGRIVAKRGADELWNVITQV